MQVMEPEYTTLKQTAEYEIRKYNDRLAVEAFETGGEDSPCSSIYSRSVATTDGHHSHISLNK